MTTLEMKTAYMENQLSTHEIRTRSKSETLIKGVKLVHSFMLWYFFFFLREKGANPHPLLPCNPPCFFFCVGRKMTKEMKK